MEKLLLSGWFDHFRRKLISEFNIDIRNTENYQPDISPLAYCCIQHKRITPRQRTVIFSNIFNENPIARDEIWRSLQEKIESGDDINAYMSKKLNDWKSIDYLLYSCDITHFHLHKNKAGGTRSSLVFGIFTRECFYALKIGDHNDLYSPDSLISIAESSWPSLNLFKILVEPEIFKSTFDPKEFKKIANNPELQYNLINPTSFTDHNGQVKQLDNHQNTALTNVTLNNVSIGKIPLKVYVAYLNEANFLEFLDANLYSEYRAKRMTLTINDKEGKYSIEIHRGRSVKKIRSIPRKIITCSRYENFRSMDPDLVYATEL